MSKTRFMTVLFSATENGDEELTKQIHDEIQSAKENGSYEDEDGEMSYQDLGDKGVLALDKETGEYTLIHNDPVMVGDDVMIDLEEIPEYCVEDYMHPEVSENEGSFIYNPMADKNFSVSTDNTAVLKIFSDQDLVETVSESVYHSEQDAQVGDLKFEKDSDEDGVIVTDLSSGDKAKVELDGENMKVTELDQKNFKSFSNKDMEVIRRKVFSNAEQYEPIFVVGIDPINKVLVNSPVYGEEAANELAEKLMERGLIGVAVMADPDEAREYAISMLCNEGVESMDQVADEEEMEVAQSEFSVIGNRYFSDRTRFMSRLFSEAEENVADHQELVESAIEDGDQLETEDFIITPVDESTAVVEDKDNGEFTVAELDGEDINVEEISEEQANEMMEGLEVEADEEPEMEEEPAEEVEEVKEFSNVRKVQKSYNAITNGWKALKSKVGDMKVVKDAITKRSESIAKTAGDKLEKLGKEGKLTDAMSDKLHTTIANSDAIAKKQVKNALIGGAAVAGTAAVGGTAYGVSRLTKKDKAASEVEDKNFSDEAALAQIEDKATEAIQNVQEAAETAIQAIEEAKQEPVENLGNIKEATYSDVDGIEMRTFSDDFTGEYRNPSLIDLID